MANWVTGELVARVGDADPADTKLEPAALAKLVAMVGEGAVAGSAAKEVLAKLVDEGGDPAAIVEAEGLGRAGGDELGEIVDRAMADQADAVEKVRAGQRQGDRGDHGRRDARDQGHRRRRRGAAADPRAALRADQAAPGETSPAS